MSKSIFTIFWTKSRSLKSHHRLFKILEPICWLTFCRIINIEEIIDDLELYAGELDAVLSGPMTVSLEIGGVTYSNTGIWTQYDSGSGSWISCYFLTHHDHAGLGFG
ncbi:MAG: hypothetical protein D3904_12735 [Candidatus Electrothrix sp. EH2]|nr:hypothetical protein [Candidatus Electrothrix sp. EH2]